MEHNCIGLKLFEDFFGIFWDWDRFRDFVGFGRKSLLLRFALSNSKSSNISFKWVERNKRPSRNHFSSLFFDQFSHFWQLTIIFSVKVWLKPKSILKLFELKPDDFSVKLKSFWLFENNNFWPSNDHLAIKYDIFGWKWWF